MVTFELDRALPVEVCGRVVLVEVREHWCQRLAAVDDVAGLGSFAVHEHREAGVAGEQRLLAFGVAPVCTMGVRVEELTDGEPIRSFGWVHLGVDSHGNPLGENEMVMYTIN